MGSMRSVLHKSMRLQNSEEFMYHMMMMSSSMMDDCVKAMYQLHMSGKSIHVSHVQHGFHMTF